MKKTLIIILSIAVIIVAGVLAYNIIGKNEPKENEGIVDNSQVGENTEKNEDESTEADEEEEHEEEMMLVRIYGKIYASYPSDWCAESDTQMVTFLQDNSCLVNLMNRNVSSFDGELEDIVDFLSKWFADGCSKYCSGSIYGSKIETTSMERSKVAGYDCVKFKGTIKNGDWDCHVYGYGLIVEDRVIMVTGLVSEKTQDAAKIAEIDALTDQIAESIHVKK